MKVIAIVACLFAFWANQALAISQINSLVIKDAQEYGRRLAFENYSSFMAPWTAYEEKAQKLDNLTEHAQLFTPYILVATDARERTLSGQPVTMENSEKALAQYDGYLVFRVNLYLQDQHAFEKFTAKLIQEKQIIPVYYISPAAKTHFEYDGKQWTSAQFYLYFSDKTILRNLPIVLRVIDNTNSSRSFFFDLGKIL